jgi:hypothetical protein
LDAPEDEETDEEKAMEEDKDSIESESTSSENGDSENNIDLLVNAASQASQDNNIFTKILTVPDTRKRHKEANVGKKRKASILATEHFLTHSELIEALETERENKKKKIKEKEEKREMQRSRLNSKRV